MKYILSLLVLLCSLSTWAYTGHSLSGEAMLNGFLRMSVLKSWIPWGGIKAESGYEAIQYPHSTAVYCFSGVGVNSINSFIGVNFGGSANKIETFGKCEVPEDYLGGFFSISLNYELLKDSGSKSFSVNSAFNLGFDLEKFTQKIIHVFNDDSRSKRSLRKRMLDVTLHLAKYLGKSEARSLGKNYLWLKLMTLPFLATMGKEMKDGLDHMKFSVKDLSDIKEKLNLMTLKHDFSDIVYRIKRDPTFYQCTSKDCDEILVDVFYVLDALEDSLGECHSMSLGASAETSYNLKIPYLWSKLSYSYTYSYYGLKSNTPGDHNTALAATKAFAGHLLSQKSPSCQDIEKKAGRAFGEFLAITALGGTR